MSPRLRRLVLQLRRRPLAPLHLAAACSAPIAAASTLKPKIGIALQVSIPPLQSSVDGFKKGLASCGFVEGQNVTYDFKDGQNDIPTLQTIGLRFKDEKLDLDSGCWH